MRKGKRTRTTVQSWLFALAIPAVALFMLFSLMPYKRMVEPWPWGIGQQEVMAYQVLFDRRPGQHAQGKAERFTITAETGNGTVMLAASGDTIQARETGLNAGLLLNFQPGKTFQGMGSVEFTPAGLHSLDALYAQVVADSLPIRSPRTKLVELERNSAKPSPWLAQEPITADYVLHHAPVASVLIGLDGQVQSEEGLARMTGDSIGRDALDHVDGGNFDTASTAALGLLACAMNRTDLLDGSAGAIYDQVTARVEPLFKAVGAIGRDTAVGRMASAFRKALADPAAQLRIGRLAAHLRKDSAAWAARFLAIDSAAVPVLANGRNLGLVQAEVDHRREAFLKRLFNPLPEQFIGKPVPLPAPAAINLDPWLVQFRTEKDTIRFVRGKYNIDHDLVLPPGMAVVLEKGTRWFMAPGVSVVVNGPLHMRGTDLNPVFIRPQSDTAFGAIVVNGSGNTRVRIRGLRISGGSDLRWQGIRFGGMLTFHRADVHMDHCSIDASMGMASVSIRRSTVAIADCYIADAKGTGLYLSECDGRVERSSVLRNGGAIASNGMALFSTHLLLRGCTFADLQGTAVALSRASDVLISGCRMTGNATAVDAIEGSQAYVDGCEFIGIGKVFVISKGSPVLGGASIVQSNNTFVGNAGQEMVDPSGKLESATSVDPKVWRAFGGAAGR